MADYLCAICGKKCTYEGALPAAYPFCSQRCRLVDLGRWLREEYTIEREIMPDDLPPESLPPNGTEPAD
ncbi:MAG: DNA gyrase inhibitor YacG [Phycisphaerae bacterium]|jgi:endogenous inhibitor of DNA gyrase (YacG/DUF329 family)